MHLALYNDVVVFDHATKLAYVISWVHIDEHPDVDTAYQVLHALPASYRWWSDGPSHERFQLDELTSDRCSCPHTGGPAAAGAAGDAHHGGAVRRGAALRPGVAQPVTPAATAWRLQHDARAVPRRRRCRAGGDRKTECKM